MTYSKETENSVSDNTIRKGFVIDNCNTDKDEQVNTPNPISASSTVDTNLETEMSYANLENLNLLKNTDFSNIQQMQQNDTHLRDLIKYLQNGQLQQSQKLAGIVKHTDYAFIHGLLFHSCVIKSKRIKTLSHYQLVVPKLLIPTVLKLYHDSLMGAHGGIQDTLDRLKEHYYFDKMSVIVSDYVKWCPECQKRKVTKTHTKSTITAYLTPTGPFQL